MNFVSGLFVLFLITTIILFYALPARLRMPLLLVMSYLFYASWNVPFIALILLSTTIDYWMSHIIAASRKTSVRRGAFAFGLLVNLGILAYFKYANFFLENAHGLLGWFNLGAGSLPRGLEIILPLGISFYTFEAVSYMVDVYRGGQPARGWLKYNFYIMYFPHLISGPIIRFRELMPQYAAPLQRPSMQQIARGMELLLLGYIFKVLIADQVAELADPVFHHPQSLGVLESYLGVLAFTVQIYFDFMGYTHIARGASALFNIELPLNFNHPYLATNISNFWERWHISLSRWIRDYLYFPLGGSRGTLLSTVFNLLLTMAICGFWHGAGWTFILWGVYHGILLAAYHVFRHWKKRAGFSIPAGFMEKIWNAASLGFTFLLVIYGWVLFRAPTPALAGDIFTQLLNGEELVREISTGRHAGTMAGILLLLAVCWLGPWAVRALKAVYHPLPFWVKVQAVCVLALVCWLITAEGTVPFIYFQF